MQSVLWGRELEAVGQGVGAQRHPAQPEEGGEEGRPQHTHPPQHGRQGGRGCVGGHVVVHEADDHLQHGLLTFPI